MAEQQAAVQEEFTPEQKKLFAQLLEDFTDALDETYIPFVLFNREKAINNLQMVKNDIEKLEGIL